VEELIARLAEIADHLVDRLDGPMCFRFVLQPTVASILGVLDGLRFAREGRSFLLWGGPSDPAERRAQRDATLRCIGKVFVLAIVLDLMYQCFVLHGLYPLETLVVAVIVAIIPYFLVRFLFNIGSRRWLGPNPSDKTT
jgi:hypothetical protein